MLKLHNARLRINSQTLASEVHFDCILTIPEGISCKNTEHDAVYREIGESIINQIRSGLLDSINVKK